METWIIKDGGAELARGSHLRGVGLRANCLSVGPARTVVDGIAELADPRARQAPPTLNRPDRGDLSVDMHAIAGWPTSRSAESEGVGSAPAFMHCLLLE
jgi:hypothetical protein